MNILNRIVIATVALLVTHTGFAATPPPTVNAKGYLLFSMDSGQVLASSNEDALLEPASLTKIMTAHVVFDEIKAGRIGLDDKVLISEKAWKMGGSRMFIEVNKQVSVEELLKGLIIQSGNDAAVALAEHAAGSEEAFADLMNKTAARLGMNNSNFVNASGFPAENHYTTPADIAKVTSATIREYPEYYKWYAVREYTYNKIKQNNRNRLLWQDESVDGVKTGHTEAAGYCLVAAAERNGNRLISVVMGTDSDASRAAESRKLLNYGFRFFETVKIFSAATPIQQVRIWKGDREQLPVGVAKDVIVTLPRGEKDSLKANMSLTTPLEAPVTQGEQLGNVSLNLNGETLKSVPLVALETVAEGGVFSSIKDSILLMFE